MLEHLLAGRQAEFLAQRAELLARNRRDRSIVARVEAAVEASVDSTLQFDATGAATLRAVGHVFAAGRFETPTLGALRQRAQARASAGNRARLFVLVGSDDATDIGALQGTAAPGSVFQVASQFNCLEAPGPGLVPVARYFGDSTQGPRASISAFPGTLLRHYAAPARGGKRFTQTDGRQLNLLSAALPETLARVVGGYLMTQHIADLGAAASALEVAFDDIRVGLHDEVEVAFGHKWDGDLSHEVRICQVFTSTLAVGYSDAAGDRRAPVATIARQLLRAAYLGTLLAAAALGKRTVVLTLIGGGVFENPHPLIWECIEWALAEADPLLSGPLDVVVNGRDLRRALLPSAQQATRARGGACFELEAGQVRVLD